MRTCSIVGGPLVWRLVALSVSVHATHANDVTATHANKLRWDIGSVLPFETGAHRKKIARLY
jgi:hypothetical protein